jgi:hypothetical protein
MYQGEYFEQDSIGLEVSVVMEKLILPGSHVITLHIIRIIQSKEDELCRVRNRYGREEKCTEFLWDN